MTRNGILNAAAEHLSNVKRDLEPAMAGGEQDINDPRSIAHLLDMYERMRPAGPNAFSEGKMNRWLGYIQGVLVTRGLISLDQAKDCSRRHKDD